MDIWRWCDCCYRIKRVNPTTDADGAIRYASENGHTEVVRLLLQDDRVDPSAYMDYAITCSAENGHVEVVGLLLQDSRVDPSAFDNYAIRRAALNGHSDVVNLLLRNGRVDPSAEDNEAIKIAAQKNHLDVVRILLNDERVDPSVCTFVFPRQEKMASMLMCSKRFCEQLVDEEPEMTEEQVLEVSLHLVSSSAMTRMRMESYSSSSRVEHKENSTFIDDIALEYLQLVSEVLKDQGEIPQVLSTNCVVEYVVGCSRP